MASRAAEYGAERTHELTLSRDRRPGTDAPKSSGLTPLVLLEHRREQGRDRWRTGCRATHNAQPIGSIDLATQ